MAVNLKNLSDDDCYKRWQDHIERIKHETIYLFTTRSHFREVVEMFQKNQKLGDIGGEVYRWLLGIWGRDALIALRRELDGQTNTINLVHLFEEMCERPTILSRRRYIGHCTRDDGSFIKEMMSKTFAKWGCVPDGSGDPMNDYLPATKIEEDHKELIAKTKKAFDYAQRMVAHRTPIEDLEITVKDINEAIDAIEPMLQKYYLLFTGSSLVSATATTQYDWAEPFEIPWRLP